MKVMEAMTATTTMPQKISYLPLVLILVLTLGTSLSTAACGPGADNAASRSQSAEQRSFDTEDAEFGPFVLPDLSELAAPIRQQIDEQHARVVAGLERGDRSRTENLAEGYGDLGRLLVATELGHAAQMAFRHAAVLAPNDPRWPYLLGHAYRSAGEQRRAIAAFERALEIDPIDATTLVWLAETNLDDGRAAEAGELFLEAAAALPSSAAPRFGAGRAALARQSYREAVDHFEAALALEPGASAIRYPLAMTYRTLGDAQAAQSNLEQRGDVWPVLDDPLMQTQPELLETVTAFEIRGLDALAAADWEAAATAFRGGLELEPDDPALRHRLGTALYAAGNVASAIEEFEEVTRRSPDFTDAHVSLGTILSVQGAYDRAIERFSVALESDPNSVAGRFGLAEVLRVSGQSEDSLPHYERVIQLDPTIVEAWIGRVAALITLQRSQAARDALADAELIHPGHPQLTELAALLPPT